MVALSKKKTFKKAGASIEEELPETRYAKSYLKVKPEEMKDLRALFTLIQGRAARIEAINFIIEHKITLKRLVRKLREDKSRLK
jgi:hypothetical protein